MQEATKHLQDIKKAEVVGGVPKDATEHEKKGFRAAVFKFKSQNKGKEPPAARVEQWFKKEREERAAFAARVIVKPESDVGADITRDLTRAQWEKDQSKKGEEALRKRHAAEQNTKDVRERSNKRKRKNPSTAASSNGSKDRHDQSGLAAKQTKTGILPQKKRELPPADTHSTTTTHIPATPAESKRSKPNSKTVLNDRTQHAKREPVQIKTEPGLPADIAARGSKEERRAARAKLPKRG